MKRNLLVLVILITVFVSIWGIKVRNISARPDDVLSGNNIPWYESRYETPTADKEWVLDEGIPDNYIPMPGSADIFMVVDDNGNITSYVRGTKNTDGSWTWEETNPDIPDEYVPVEGLDNVYRHNGRNYLYVRNADNSFAFVEVDDNGVPTDNGADASVITTNYVHVKDNVYSLYNDNNVLVGYRERVNDETTGNYIWKVTEQPVIDSSLGGDGFLYEEKESTAASFIDLSGGNDSAREDNDDGTYTVTEKTRNTITEGGYNITTETIKKKTYSSDGTLISEDIEGPYEVSRILVSDIGQNPDEIEIADTIDGELARLEASGITFSTDKADSLLAMLNTERQNKELPPVVMDLNSDAYKLAALRAADMAAYDYAGAESILYGSINNMITTYSLSCLGASENIWKAQNKSVSDINARFMANEGSRELRLSTGFTQYACCIVERNGSIYVAEVFLYK